MARRKNDKVLKAKDLGIDLRGSEQIMEEVDDPSRTYLTGGDPMAGSQSDRASLATEFSSGSVRSGKPKD